MSRIRAGGLGVGLRVPGAFHTSRATTMEPNKNTLERAFELARSGKFNTPEEIKRQLKAEGYDDHAITGRSLLMQLRTIIASSKGP